MHEVMIGLLDHIYLLERKKHDEVEQILINPYYAHFTGLDYQKEQVDKVKVKYNQQLNELYDELNQQREKNNYQSLNNPYKKGTN